MQHTMLPELAAGFGEVSWVWVQTPKALFQVITGRRRPASPPTLPALWTGMQHACCYIVTRIVMTAMRQFTSSSTT